MGGKVLGAQNIKVYEHFVGVAAFKSFDLACHLKV